MGENFDRFSMVSNDGDMQFRPVIVMLFVVAQFFFKSYKNSDIQKPKAWSFRLWKNCFSGLS